MAEIFDIYDENMQHIGTKERSAVHRDGDWHKTFHAWVIFRNEKGDWVVLQKRSADKDTFPNLLDISAAGHYAAGERMQDGVRELHEELGLTEAKFEDLISLGQRKSVAKYDGVFDSQVSDVFFYVCNKPLNEYRYQTSELAGLIALPVKEGLQLFRGEIDCLEVPAVGYVTDTIVLSRKDFIPTEDEYMEKILLLAPRCLDGESNLSIE
jgi:isopentenyldiphosphate isomerase